MTPSARRLIAVNRVSANGYYGALFGGLNWVAPDAELDAAVAPHLSCADTVLMGRRTYELFEAVRRAHETPTTEDAPSKKAAAEWEARRRLADALRDTLDWLAGASKVVYSTQLETARWPDTRIARHLDPAEIAAMKSTAGRDIVVLGSGAIVSQLMLHGLIDAYLFLVCPVLLGHGRPLLGGVTHNARLTLVEATPTKSGGLLLHYARRATEDMLSR